MRYAQITKRAWESEKKEMLQDGKVIHEETRKKETAKTTGKGN